MKIKKVCIKNYKSFSKEGCTFNCTNVMGVIGSNSAGKTNLLSAIELFFVPRHVNEEDFHNKNINDSIDIEITFTTDSYEKNIHRLLFKDNEITLCRKYIWNDKKQYGERGKNTLPKGFWQLNPKYSKIDPLQKNGVTEMRSMASECPEYNSIYESLSSAEITNLEKYKRARDIFLDQQIQLLGWLENNAQWVTEYDTITDLKQVYDLTESITLPEFVYIPVDHTVQDELDLKKGSKLEMLFQMLFTDITQDETSAELSSVKKSIDHYYGNTYDKKLKTLNHQLNELAENWNFSESKISVKRQDYNLIAMLSPKWDLFLDDGFDSNIQTKGNGAQRLALFQLLQLYLNLKNRKGDRNIILAIEEPELFLHPPYRRAMYDLFRKLSNSIQIIYTTHEPMFVRMEYFDEIIIVRKNANNESVISQVDFSLFDSNDLWKRIFGRKKTEDSRRGDLSNKCGTEQNDGFFAEKVILVEGNTEIYSLPIYFSKFGLNINHKNYSIVRADGVDSLVAIYAVFNAFNIPVYIIFDGDKPKEEHFQIFNRIPQSKIKEYQKFVEIYEKYLTKDDESSLEELKKISKKLGRDIISSTCFDYITSESIDKNELKSAFSAYCLNKTQVEEYQNKLNRDKNLLQILQYHTDKEGFLDTIIASNFTMWERNFEEDVSKHMTDYQDLEAYAKKNITGKPLIAKYVATRAQVKNMDTYLKNNLTEMVTLITGLNTVLRYPVNNITIDKSNSIMYVTDVVDGKKQYPVLHYPLNHNEIISYTRNLENCNEYISCDFADEKVTYFLKLDNDVNAVALAKDTYIAIEKKETFSSNKFSLLSLVDDNENPDILIRQCFKQKGKDIPRVVAPNTKESLENAINIYGEIQTGKDRKIKVFIKKK